MESNLFGTYLTRSFSDILPDIDTVYKTYKMLPKSMQVIGTFTDDVNDDLERIFLLLMSRYKNSHIANTDEDQFILQFYTILYTYGPIYLKQCDIQAKLRSLNLDDIQKGTAAIYNHAYNPGVTGTSTQDATELTYINDQNTTNYKKGKVEAYADYLTLLRSNPTEAFLDQFKDLFLKIVEPYNELIYYGE